MEETRQKRHCVEAPLTPEQLEALRRINACTLANAIETFHRRLRNEGFVDRSIRAIFPSLQPMVGFAATVKTRQREEEIIALCRSPAFSLEGLREPVTKNPP